MTTDFSYVGAFLVGLMGAGHCLGMCGGIVGALAMAVPDDEHAAFFQRKRWQMTLLYHFGRVFSYTLAGAVVGGLTYWMSEMVQMKSMLLGMRLLAGSMMLMIGLYLAHVWRGLHRIEVVGHFLWQKVMPFAQRTGQFKTHSQAMVAGFFWGWLPCGLVYSTLTWALATGHPIEGARIMLAFGLGTMPGLLLMGGVAYKFKAFVKMKNFQLLGALAMLCFGCHTLWIAWMQW